MELWITGVEKPKSKIKKIDFFLLFSPRKIVEKKREKDAVGLI